MEYAAVVRFKVVYDPSPVAYTLESSVRYSAYYTGQSSQEQPISPHDFRSVTCLGSPQMPCRSAISSRSKKFPLSQTSPFAYAVKRGHSPSPYCEIKPPLVFAIPRSLTLSGPPEFRQPGQSSKFSKELWTYTGASETGWGGRCSCVFLGACAREKA